MGNRQVAPRLGVEHVRVFHVEADIKRAIQFSLAVRIETDRERVIAAVQMRQDLLTQQLTIFDLKAKLLNRRDITGVNLGHILQRDICHCILHIGGSNFYYR